MTCTMLHCPSKARWNLESSKVKIEAPKCSMRIDSIYLWFSLCWLQIKKKRVILELKKIFWKNYHQILQILQSCDICWRKGCTLFSVSWDESLIHSRKWFGHYQFIILMQRRIHMVLGLLAYSFTNLWSVTEILYIKLGKGFPSFSMLQTDYWCK